MKYALIKSLKRFILVVKQSSSSGKCNTSVPCQYEYHVDMMLLRLKKNLSPTAITWEYDAWLCMDDQGSYKFHSTLIFRYTLW